MPHRNSAPQLIAGGTINPACFVKLSTTANNTGLAGTSNCYAVGIINDETRQPQGVIGSTGEAVISGLPIPLFGIGDICNLVMGAGGCTAGDLLKSDTNGNGVTATVAGTDIYCAIALETTPASQKGRVQVLPPTKL